jgi:hypothetical protein
LNIVFTVIAFGILVFVLLGALFFSFINLFIGEIVGAIILVLFVGYVLYILIRRAFEMKRLANEGVETKGTVIRKVKFYTGGNRRYQIRYEYSDNFGRKYHNTIWVSGELYDKLEIGDPVDVVFLPSEPSVSGLLSDVELARQALQKKRQQRKDRT